MDLRICPMEKSHAEEISLWKYENEYSMYDGDESQETIDELMCSSYYSVLDNETNELIGFLCYGKPAQVPVKGNSDMYSDSGFLDIGLGLKPQYCGKGMGFKLVAEGLKYGQGKYLINKFRLTVATFNLRAIKVYEKIGFKKIKAFEKTAQDGKNIEFIIMTLI